MLYHNDRKWDLFRKEGSFLDKWLKNLGVSKLLPVPEISCDQLRWEWKWSLFSDNSKLLYSMYCMHFSWWRLWEACCHIAPFKISCWLKDTGKLSLMTTVLEYWWNKLDNLSILDGASDYSSFLVLDCNKLWWNDSLNQKHFFMCSCK